MCTFFRWDSQALSGVLHCNAAKKTDENASDCLTPNCLGTEDLFGTLFVDFKDVVHTSRAGIALILRRSGYSSAQSLIEHRRMCFRIS